MGREAKRVPLNFDWPLNKVWWGYGITAIACQYCEGRQIDMCPCCYGEGEIRPEVKIPEGKGWQMWEDCTAGSPISPVFKTPEELARWLADTKASSFGDFTATYEQWLSAINRGWTPSAVIDQDGIRSGVEAGI
jgi:hypothetical protein